MSHGDRITALPPGFSRIGVSPNAPYAAIADEARRYYGLMFHPEVVHTPDGARLIANFVHEIAGLKRDWTMAAFRREAREAIRAQVGKGRVICGLSGGVDSSVAAVLIHEAIGDQLTCVFVDHGLMRAGRGRGGGAAVPRPLQHPAGPCAGAAKLSSARSPASRTPRPSARPSAACSSRRSRRKPSSIAADGRGPVEFLAQGTLYPDVIESVSFTGGPSVTIKSHHNVGGLPERMNMRLVEPLRELFKDEVRELGKRAGPAAVLRRPPSVPRPRPRHPHPRRDHGARSSTFCARPMRSIWRRSAPRGSTIRSGRPSRCCCRCARSA